jgi:hypothetical protein
MEHEVTGITWPPESQLSNKKVLRDAQLKPLVQGVRVQAMLAFAKAFDSCQQQLADVTERLGHTVCHRGSKQDGGPRAAGEGRWHDQGN